jgi:hypothetical protein
MVHALEELRRVLVIGGTLIDLRPVADAWPVVLRSLHGVQEAGRVTDLPQALADDAAANAALEQAESAGLFQREREVTFPFQYSWDSPTEMQQYLAEEWADFADVHEDVWRRIRSLWAVADAEARVGVQLKMLITRWARVD